MIHMYVMTPFIKNIPILDMSAPPILSIPLAKQVKSKNKRNTSEFYSDRFENQLSEDLIHPQTTQKYGKLKSLSNLSNHGTNQVSVVRNQQYDLIKEMMEIPIIPDHSFESIEMSCHHGQCIRKKI